MTPVSRRHLPGIALLLALAAIPVLANAWKERRYDECRRPDLLLDTDRIGAGTGPEGERRDEYFGSVFQRSEGRIGGEFRWLQYAVVRSTNPRDLYLPAKFRHFPIFDDETRVEHLAAGDESLPVRFVYHQRTDELHVMAYFYVYDGRPATNLVGPQLATAARQLVHGRRPLTLFMASAFVPPQRRGDAEPPMRDWLVAAWRHYERACLPPREG